MKTFENILFATDFSEASRNALAHASYLARCHGAQLTIIHAITPFVTDRVGRLSEGFSMPDVLSEMVDTEAKAALEKVIPNEKISVVKRAEYGISASEVILREREKIGADLIVMGDHQRGAIARALLGSVAQLVVRNAPCSVLIVPGASSATLPKEGYRRILAPTDLSSDSEPGIRWAADLCLEYNAALSVAHVCNYLQPTETALLSFRGQTGMPDFEEVAFASRGAVEEYCTGLDIHPQEILIERGKVDRIVLELVDKIEPDLVVLSPKKPQLLGVIRLGSYIASILNHNPKPTLVVRDG